ncbi:hypothetical protein FE257_005618 [Aspergillus nanangensis]|uniref:CCCH zinc finger and RRM domain protein n=1 Tax=Aspergillus nanangensis TaxID=2582783 RepID=A0AAD4CQA8_ASPNN|nr:hypothetical protein FE257_005618 [Aspergillus nanangensis]
MQLSEDEANDVKTWVVKKLEDISDADADVLADYVLALIRSDAPDEEIRKASVENLEDFLREHTTTFVDELFATFAPKQQAAPPASHHPSLPQPPPQIPAASSLPQQQQFNAPTGPRGPYGPPAGGFPQSQGDTSPNFNRKRTYQEGFQGDQEQGNEVPQNRAFKTPRRGRGGGRGDWMGGAGRGHGAPDQFAPHPGQFPVMPPAFPGFDQNDPMAAMMAMQGMGFPPMPGMPPMPMPPGGAGPPPDQMGPKSSERCPFYETQGICYLGAACPYQHDAPAGSKEDEYDPKASSIVTANRGRDGPFRGSDRGRGRGRGGDRGGFGGRGRRSEFSAAGPNEDTSIMTIVVEQIPEDKFNDATVREFFGQYGEIVDLSLQSHRKLALITFGDHAAAKRAWSSPKVIFDNRFVKVYWHKPKGEKNGDQRRGSGDATMSEEPSFNQEEFERQQEEAQKAYEDKMKKRKETEEAKQALEKQRDELIKKQQEEKERLLQRLGGGAASNGTQSPDNAMADSPSEDNASDQTKQLRAQLAALEAEAQSLGLDPNSSEAGSFRGRGRGRGYLGRGGFPPRGRGYDPSYRGGFRGRGMARGRGGVLRLDNRPRRVAISGVDFNTEKDEALRQFLIGVGEYESIEPNPEQSDSVVVAFKERYLAEKFMFGPWKIPSVGEVQLTWVANPPISIPASMGAFDAKTGSDDDASMGMDASAPSLPPDQSGGRKEGNHDVDYDVAEDEDTWG